MRSRSHVRLLFGDGLFWHQDAEESVRSMGAYSRAGGWIGFLLLDPILAAVLLYFRVWLGAAVFIAAFVLELVQRRRAGRWPFASRDTYPF